MPYRIEQQDAQWCVVKDIDGKSETVTCFASEEEAQAQLIALNINEASNANLIERQIALNHKGRISLMQLSEAASPVPKNARLTLVCLKAGWAESCYYPASVLARDGPVVFRVGQNILSFFDHPEEGECEEIYKLAGKLVSDGVWDDQAQAIVAQAEVYPNKIEALRYCWRDVAVSIRGEGVCVPGEAEGREGLILQSLTRIWAVDYVTRAGAGGRIVNLEESLKPKGNIMLNEEKSAVTLSEATPHPSSGGAQYDKVSQDLSALRNQVETTKAALEHVLTENRKLVAQQSTLVATSFLKEKLSQISELPPIAKEKLAIQLIANIPLTESNQVDTIAFDKIIREAAIAESSYHDTYQEQLLQSGRVTGLVRGMGNTPQTANTLQEQALQQLRWGFELGGLNPSQVESAMKGFI